MSFLVWIFCFTLPLWVNSQRNVNDNTQVLRQWDRLKMMFRDHSGITNTPRVLRQWDHLKMMFRDSGEVKATRQQKKLRKKAGKSSVVTLPHKRYVLQQEDNYQKKDKLIGHKDISNAVGLLDSPGKRKLCMFSPKKEICVGETVELLGTGTYITDGIKPKRNLKGVSFNTLRHRVGRSVSGSPTRTTV